MDEVFITVLVDKVEPQGAVWLGEGTVVDSDPPRRVRFAGEWRPMKDLAQGIREDGPQEAAVPTFAVIGDLS